MNADDLARQLRPLVAEMYFALRQIAPAHHLTLAQGQVLRTLVNEGPRRLSFLAEAEGVAMPSMTNVISRLERDGLVHKAVDPLDRRAVLVSVSTEGLRYYRELVAVRERVLSSRLAQLDDVDRAAIATAIPALNRLFTRPDHGWAASTRIESAPEHD